MDFELDISEFKNILKVSYNPLPNSNKGYLCIEHSEGDFTINLIISNAFYLKLKKELLKEKRIPMAKMYLKKL